MTKMKSIPKKEKPLLLRLLAVFMNPFFWQKLFNKVKRYFFGPKEIKMYDAASDITVFDLNGVSKKLKKDYIDKTSIPLIINAGSYN